MFFEDLLSVSIVALRRSGDVRPDDTVAFVRFDGVDDEFCVRLHQRRMFRGGVFSLFVCECSRRARKLWFFNGRPSCQFCCKPYGVRFRVEHMTPGQRAAYRAEKLRAMLSSPISLKRNPRGYPIDRRKALERSLMLCELRLRRTGSSAPRG